MELSVSFVNSKALSAVEVKVKVRRRIGQTLAKF